MEVSFQWIRAHGQGDYLLRVRESQYSEINYGVTVMATMTKTDGSVKTDTISKDYEKTYEPNGYGTLRRVCQAYLEDQIVEYQVPAYTIKIGETSVTVPSMTIPPYMDSL